MLGRAAPWARLAGGQRQVKRRGGWAQGWGVKDKQKVKVKGRSTGERGCLAGSGAGSGGAGVRVNSTTAGGERKPRQACNTSREGKGTDRFY